MSFSEPFLFLKLHSFPRRIAKDTTESALFEDLRKCEMPVEESVLESELVDFGFEVFWERLTLDVIAEGAGGDAARGS